MRRHFAQIIVATIAGVSALGLTPASAHAVNGAKASYGACVRTAPVDSRAIMAPGQFGFGPAVFVNETAHAAQGAAFYANSTCSLV